jgi:hypothetical protein
MSFADKMGVVAVSATVAASLVPEVEFKEALLSDEEAFMFYNFPINSEPTDAEVAERFEEVLEDLCRDVQLANALTDVIRGTLEEL